MVRAIRFERGDKEGKRKERSRFEDSPTSGKKILRTKKEKELELKTKILILEDEYGEQAKKGLDFPCFEVKIVKNIEELKNIDPKDFQPDLIILDVNVPEKEGEEPKDNSRLSSAIVKEKFSNVPVFYYTMAFHHGKHIQGGIGEEPGFFKKLGIDDLKSIWGEDTYNKFKEKYSEFMDVSDKSRPENWIRALLILPILTTQASFLSKINSFYFWPEELKEKMLGMLELTNPNLASSIKRYWENVIKK